jgi:hypothetical protein
MTQRVRTLSVREQAAWMRQYHPQFQTTSTNREFRSIGSLQPTDSSRLYTVTILYEAGRRPAAYVAGLRTRPGAERAPHTYGPDRPCLFHPKGREWRDDMIIATSFVPWLSVWLYFYEVWLATGEWEGGGIDHTPVLEEGDVPDS